MERNLSSAAEALGRSIVNLDKEVRKLPQTPAREKAVSCLLAAQLQLELAGGWLADADESETA